ncbi:SDR family oxidoreductase [Telmatobacter bradus]|uniref:SDR family oxidoreductase n=1 Tax=Telmatobacter bradus TaxID=474953 RepID=UPI003B4382BA
MRVFVTGATGFIGSAVVKELIGLGHQVLGLARSEAGAQSVVATGAEVHRGDLEDLASLRSGAAAADAVIHTAFIHDFSKFKQNCEIDRLAIDAIGEELAGSGKLLIVTAGTAVAKADPNAAATEDDPPLSSTIAHRASEEAADAVAAKGVRVAVVRLPQVHDTVKQGLVSYAIQVAREKGVVAYIGDGLNRWSAVHRLDAAHLFCLALGKGEGNVRYHAVAEEGVSAREIAETIGHGMHLPAVSIAPEEAPAHFGWLALFAEWDLSASSAKTRARLGWEPTGPMLITDLKNMRY